jgi:hypothetical protein
MHDVEPLSEERLEAHYKSLGKGTSNNVICCVLADIFHNSTDEHVRLQCRRAAAMAKAMSRKLADYKQGRC